jgi:hypothetical protein
MRSILEFKEYQSQDLSVVYYWESNEVGIVILENEKAEALYEFLEPMIIEGVQNAGLISLGDRKGNRFLEVTHGAEDAHFIFSYHEAEEAREGEEGAIFHIEELLADRKLMESPEFVVVGYSDYTEPNKRVSITKVMQLFERHFFHDYPLL